MKVLLSSNFEELTLANLDGEEAFFKDVRTFLKKSLFSVKPYNSAQASKLYKVLQKEHSENKLSQNYMKDHSKNSQIIHWLKYQNMCYLDRDITWILREFEKEVVPPPEVVINTEGVFDIVEHEAIKNLKNARYRNAKARRSKDTQATDSSLFFKKRNSRNARSHMSNTGFS